MARHLTPLFAAALVAVSLGGVQSASACGCKSTFERNKPHVNVGTIGHVDHGKVKRSSRKRLKAGPRRSRRGLGWIHRRK